MFGEVDYIGVAVEDLGASIAAGRAATRGVRDSRVAFIHPKSAGGVLTELVQPAVYGVEDGDG